MSAARRGRKIFDSHFHIIDSRFPLVPNNGYLPDDFSSDDYTIRAGALGVVGGAVVSGSFQAFDQSYLVDALKRLGPCYVGVTQLPASVSDDELLQLDAAGVRAVRFNLRRGGSEGVEKLESFARRVFDTVKWHVELYVDSRDLGELQQTLLLLPAVSIDHLGLSRDGFSTLLYLVERGVKVKATGFGRVDFDVARALRDICAADPSALMFGTDLPSTRAPRPFENHDVDLVVDALGEDLARRVFFDNAVHFYRPAEVPRDL